MRGLPRWIAPGWGPARAGRSRARSVPGPSVDLRVLLDSSSIEVFVDGGRLVLSARIYPVDGDELLCLDADGGDVVVDLTAWPMRSADE